MKTFFWSQSRRGGDRPPSPLPWIRHCISPNQFESVRFVIIYSFSNDIPFCNSLDVADILPAYPLEQKNSLVIIFFIPYLTLPPPPLPPPRDPDLVLLVFEPPSNSTTNPHERKIACQLVIRIIRLFPLTNIDSIFTSDGL